MSKWHRARAFHSAPPLIYAGSIAPGLCKCLVVLCGHFFRIARFDRIGEAQKSASRQITPRLHAGLSN